jgi:uncharacterized DUF497 family protein
VATVVSGVCEWDSEKAEANERKHGVSFDEAATVFADPQVVFVDDGSGAGPLKAIGLSTKARVLIVVHVERGERDRIISARMATADEETLYNEGS